MRRLFIALFICVLYAPHSYASELGTPAEAKNMAEAAAAFYKEKGLDALVERMAKKDPKFFMKDLYVFVGRKDGISIAHGAAPQLKGRNLLNLKDVDGAFFVKDMIQTATTGKKRGWVDYRWPHPVSKKILPKTAYIIGISEDLHLGVGAYK